MFSTKIQVRHFSRGLPTLLRLGSQEAEDDIPVCGMIYEDATSGWFQLRGYTFEIATREPRALWGDVILVNPERGIAERIIRAGSDHNTFLITERCDQVCIMCSQPPKDYDLDLFSVYRAALAYAPANAVIGISGGEPLLYKSEVFELIEEAAKLRPDIGFHILTNGQHLEDLDIEKLGRLPHQKIRFAVPIYAADPDTHDKIVGKVGAHKKALTGIATLMEAGAEVEVRTVIMRQNVADLENLAQYIAWTMPDIDHWALMQLEYIGFAKKNWDAIFYDHSLDASPLTSAIETAEQHGVNCLIYNTPLCTLPPHLHKIAPRTISDWKQSYPDQCSSCTARLNCSGVFAWQTSMQTFRNLEPI